VSRVALALALVVVAGALGVAGARAGQAPAVSGTFTMTSEQGDYIGGGQTYSYDAAALVLGTSHSGRVTVSVLGGFSVNLGAPGGEQLSPGTYEGAVRSPDASQAHLDVSGDGRGCNQTFGSFTVHDVEYGIHGYLQSLHATFEQHCEEPTAPALRGDVHVEAAPPPVPLELDLTFDDDRTILDEVTGLYSLHGSIECSQEVAATVVADVREVGRESNGVGSNGTSVQCSPAATDWVVTVGSSNSIAFTPGAFEAEVRGEAIDDYYTAYTGEGFVYARDEASGSSEVVAPGADTGSVAANRGGLTGFIERQPTAAALMGVGILLVVAVASVLATLLVTGRGRPSSDDRGDAA
jgi:hypothetical protein